MTPEERRGERVITLRMTLQELEALDRLCKASHHTRSHMIRQLIKSAAAHADK